MFQGVKALALTDMWHTSRLGCCVCLCLFNLFSFIVTVQLARRSDKVDILTADRTVQVTPEAAAKAPTGEGRTDLESVFTASLLPVDFFRDMIRRHSAKAMSRGSNGSYLLHAITVLFKLFPTHLIAFFYLADQGWIWPQGRGPRYGPVYLKECHVSVLCLESSTERNWKCS